jgi:hypothetical protein
VKFHHGGWVHARVAVQAMDAWREGKVKFHHGDWVCLRVDGIPCALPHAVYMQRDDDDFDGYGKTFSAHNYFQYLLQHRF